MTNRGSPRSSRSSRASFLTRSGHMAGAQGGCVTDEKQAHQTASPCAKGDGLVSRPWGCTTARLSAWFAPSARSDLPGQTAAPATSAHAGGDDQPRLPAHASSSPLLTHYIHTTTSPSTNTIHIQYHFPTTIPGSPPSLVRFGLNVSLGFFADKYLYTPSYLS